MRLGWGEYLDIRGTNEQVEEKNLMINIFVIWTDSKNVIRLTQDTKVRFADVWLPLG